MADGDNSVLDAAIARNPFQPGDWAVVGVYLVAVLGVGIWSSCRNRGSTKGYFLAGRSMHLIPVGASLFASNIGSGHFVGLAGSGATNGIGVSVFELSATFVLLLLGWVFVPVYIAAGVFTMPEYLRKRFGGQRIRIYNAVLSLLLYIFTKVSADMYSGALFLDQAVPGLNTYVSVVLLLALAMFFTVAGGLTAVIWTDLAQTGFIMIGAVVLMILSFIEVGKGVDLSSWSSIYEVVSNGYFAALSSNTILSNITSVNATPPVYSMNIMRPIDDGNDLPWTGVVFGLTVSGIWYWCTDQVIVQRALAAKNISHARAGTIVAGYLKFTPLWLLVIPGMISRILYPNAVACATAEDCLQACNQDNGCTNAAYPLLISNIMPTGAKGLMIACVTSALMSSLTSIFNSSSTIFTMDIWRQFRKNAGEGELLVVGRVFVVILVGASVAWIPVVKSVPQLFNYIQQVTSFLTPPITAVFVLALSWKRINEQGAFWGLMVGQISGLIRFILQFFVYDPDNGPVPDVISKVHFLHFGCILFLLTAAVAIVISYLTKPIDPRKLVRLTYIARFELGERLEHDAEEEVPEHLEDLKNGKYNEDETAKSTEKLTDDIEEDTTPVWRVAVNWICGIEKQVEVEISDEEQAALEAKSLSIDEKTVPRMINNVNAVILIVATTFMWGFFA